MKTKHNIFSDIEAYLKQAGLSIIKVDMERPWGGFFVINEREADQFIACFFPELKSSQLSGGKLSPKILLVAPQKKLSWQYHYRRSEIWKLIDGNVTVVTSDNDVENETVFLKKGDMITLKQGERHRLIGLEEWGVVAEIWIHTDADHPSDEEDIVRLQDDFGR